MDPILDALLEASRTDLLPHGATVLLAVSGGADSLALLYGATEVSGRTGWTLAVGHVHHGWRGREADRDVSFVRDHARRLRLPVFWRAVDARAHARSHGLSPEAAARQLRYQSLIELKADAGASRIATAHQREDRLESFLLARQRRGGVASLGGPRPLRADGVARPLLNVSRGEILDFLAARGLSWRRDSSNGNLSLPRNRLRRQLAHRRAGGGERIVSDLLARARQAAEARNHLLADFDDRVRPHLTIAAGTALADADALTGLAADLQRRAIEELALPFARPGRPPLTGREREQLRDRLASGSDFRFEAGRRIRFERRGRLLTARVREGAARV
jgi:tRNA(Ile)-lysidine synthase